MTMAKGIGGGYPLSAVVGKSEIMDSAGAGGLGGTYAGSPVACASGLKVLEIIEEEGLVNRANELGALFNKRLTALQTKYPQIISDVRNLGAMIAIELMEDSNPNNPNSKLTKSINC